MKKASVLVTGGAGFIGSHLSKRLINEGYNVAVIDNLSAGKLENLDRRVSFVKCNITSKKFSETVKKLKPQFIFHFAAQSSINKSIQNPVKDIKVNLIAVQNLVDVLNTVKVQKIIFASSAAVYKPTEKIPIKEESPKEPISLYGASKLCAEYIFKNNYRSNKMRYLILRFANVYGERQGSNVEGGVVAIFCNKIIRKKPVVIFGDGRQTRDFIYVSDVVDASIEALKDYITGEFNVSTGVQTSVINLFEKLSQISGSNTKKFFKPEPFLKVKRSSLSYQKFKEATSWQPTISLSIGLRKTFDYFKTLR